MIILPAKIVKIETKFHKGTQIDRISQIQNIQKSMTTTIKNMESALGQKI